MASNTTTRDQKNQALLSEAIKAATKERLQKTLQEICDEKPEAFEIACAKLLIGSTTKPDPSPGQKRNQRFEICEQCGEEFDVEKNSKSDEDGNIIEEGLICVWHSGEMEPDFDGDFWTDHDERCHGEIDSDEMRKEFPEGFI